MIVVRDGDIVDNSLKFTEVLSYPPVNKMFKIKKVIHKNFGRKKTIVKDLNLG
ncbi:hypothetical protein cpu_06060 [Carboxydothermus pertinax]|uniref:Uncharacterized protein n=1 Tax=Carboxydothermus pertinax TaxID=870242 RepID=A0A1L8CT45_9THEO|nr:hypothetical protein cpu_06060 [Carboxydothermus pertinax]